MNQPFFVVHTSQNPSWRKLRGFNQMNAFEILFQ